MAHLHCDRAMAQAGAADGQPRHPALVLATTILASSLAFVDGSVVNVGLPSIGRALGGGPADLQWVINAYLLPLSALLLLGGAMGDRFGRRTMLVGGVILFAVASGLCAAAPSLPWLLAGRVVQGVGAAALMPSSLAILGASFSGEAKGRSIGIWAAMASVTGAIGPVLGGWLIDGFGWRTIFLLNLPLALGAVVLALAFVREPRDGEARPHLDLSGAALATAALGLATWGLTVGSSGKGWSPPAVAAVVAGAVLAAAFVWVEKTKGARAMAPLALFASSTFVGLTLLTLLLYGALGGLMVLVPYVVIEAAGYSGTQAGAALLPFAAVLAVTSPAMGALAGRIGSRIPLTVGPLLVAVGFLLALRIGARAPYWSGVFPAILVIAIGMAGAVAPLTTAVLSSVERRYTGSASGLNSAVARTGGLVATALLGGVLGAKGASLIAAFHFALVVCAAASAAAGLCALFLVRGGGSGDRSRT